MNGQIKKIPLRFFDITFYKKETRHMEFTNMELLNKFNIYASQSKGWLLSCYGKNLIRI